MSDSWVPPQGKRSVAPGSSLIRALQARKSGGQPGKGPRHIREFYSFRYNFKPPSVDTEERGRVIVEGNTVTVERPSTQSSEAHRWIGQEAPAKEWDCVLIYDEANDSYTLEKLESVLTLKHQPRMSINEATVPTVSPTKHRVPYTDEPSSHAADQDEDAEGEDYFEEILPDALKQEEEEEEEEGEVLPSPPPPPVAKAPTKPIPASNVPEKSSVKSTPAAPAAKPTPPPPPASAPLPKARPKPVPLPRGKKNKRDPEPAPPVSASHHLSDADEEDLQFGKPAKRARPSPPQQSQGGLALPSPSTAAFIPPAPVSAPLPVPAPAPPLPDEPIEVGSESEEDDDDWDEVVGKAVDVQDDFDIFGDAAGGADDKEEMGMDDELERELNMHMDEEGDEEDEDFLAAVVEEAPPTRGAPLSLQELAAATYGSDDYSSSDDSDDD